MFDNNYFSTTVRGYVSYRSQVPAFLKMNWYSSVGKVDDYKLDDRLFDSLLVEDCVLAATPRTSANTFA
jgi:hypothetical protein